MKRFKHNPNRIWTTTATMLALVVTVVATTVQAAVTSPPATTQPAQASAVESSAVPGTADAPGAEVQVQAVIRQVHGIVQYRTADDQPWHKVTEGLKLDVGVEFRTGPRSSVTFFLPPDQVITLDRLGTLKLLDAVNNHKGDEATTELGMRYGRTRYQVEGAQGVEHQATIRSPSATLAIRGTRDVTLTDQRPGPVSASTLGSRVFFRTTHGRNRVIFGSRSDLNRQTVTDGDSSPADYTNKRRIVDPGAHDARSQTDTHLLDRFELYNGSQLSQQRIRRITVKKSAPTRAPKHEGCGCDAY